MGPHVHAVMFNPGAMAITNGNTLWAMTRMVVEACCLRDVEYFFLERVYEDTNNW